MARGRSTPETWRIVMEKRTGRVMTFNPAVNPEMTLASEKKKYEELGKFNREKDAENFCQYRELGLLPDAVAYLSLERNIRHKIVCENQINQKELDALVNAVREESGRTCFGTCKSLDGAPACATCFTHLQKTWELCASIKCIDNISEE